MGGGAKGKQNRKMVIVHTSTFFIEERWLNAAKNTNKTAIVDLKYFSLSSSGLLSIVNYNCIQFQKCQNV